MKTPPYMLPRSFRIIDEEFMACVNIMAAACCSMLSLADSAEASA